MPQTKLVLGPKQSLWRADSQLLATLLTQLQLIAEPLPGSQRYRCGERFLELITFLGCSPYIALQPEEADENGNYCHIHLPEPAEGMYSAVDNRSTPPRCPSCRKPLEGWQQQFNQWQADQERLWSCEVCGEQAAPWFWNWRKQAMFAGTGIEVFNIHPHEAVPSQELLEALQTLSNHPWHYAYVRTE